MILRGYYFVSFIVPNKFLVISMLSRKNKDLRTIKEGVVGKYVKKETPPEMPSKYKVYTIRKK